MPIFVHEKEVRFKIDPKEHHLLSRISSERNTSLNGLIKTIILSWVERNSRAQELLKEDLDFQNFIANKNRESRAAEAATITQLPASTQAAPLSSILTKPLPIAKSDPSITADEAAAFNRVAKLEKCMPISWRESTFRSLRWQVELGLVPIKLYDDTLETLSPEEQRAADKSTDLPKDGGLGPIEAGTNIIKVAKRGLPVWYAAYAKSSPEDIPPEGFVELGAAAPGVAGGGAPASGGVMLQDAESEVPSESGANADMIIDPDADDTLRRGIRALVADDEEV